MKLKRDLYLWLADRLGLEAWPPGHFYSALPVLGAQVSAYPDRAFPIPGLDIDLPAMRQYVGWMTDQAEAIAQVFSSGAYFIRENSFFSGLDAVALVHAMQVHRPARVVEIGGGHSTALMLDTIDVLGLESLVTCVEPYPVRLSKLRRHERLTVEQQPVESLDPSFFERLGGGDILFIDSSHVVKSGSDVLFLLLNVLPRLPVGVLVHFHDIYLPDDYPLEWRRERRAWNESYFLHAFLMHNQDFEIVFTSHIAAREFPVDLAALGQALGSACAGGGSCWIRRIRASA